MSASENVTRATSLSAEDIVVAIAAGAAGPYELDPVRLMKGCFLVSQRGQRQWREAFDFQPYDYGPFDRGVYRARNALLARELLCANRSSRYPAYFLTESGRARAAEIEAAIGERAASWLARIGRYVTSKSFSQLLDEIYAAYPEYAARSVMRSA